ncbi:putative Glycosyl transferase, family 2 [Magnetospirillum gryphiswaldense MSR-1 v2]|uniref:Glycosyl transferase, family 2 n=1 Tax=Magnetospirillum gryphiswaldense (strain DSM 6361 / JCM 21280 / NBRC 15271 / MSR-1) TaxID=431944 RepID=V6F914_MAGGM|nr:glycosyltransferase family 2 protein [Magnetospirillum gryphiswaldense]CDL01453.1 putative Glycosyl transferase, family 2 [Magnetospirillum gryphiswaldense MSR-1 v2]
MTESAEKPVAPVLSLVVPMFNEAGNLDRLFDRLAQVMADLGESYEIVCVDDGSRDDTVARALEHRRRDPRIKVVELSRNFGKELALTAGLRHTSGQAVVMIDADLQHPPEVIKDMMREWRQGFEMVIAVRRDRDDESAVKRLAAKVFYEVFGRVSEVRLPPGAGDFRLLDRKVVKVLNAMPEHARFMKGLYAWVGFRQTIIPFDVAERAHGETKFNLFRLWRLAVDGITSFTSLPLKVWTFMGMLVASFALLYGLLFIVKTLILGIDVPGYPSLIVAITFFSGVQLISLGVIGEYLGRVFAEVKNRPLFVVREAHGCGDDVDKE